ncbi:MAG: glycosyltransferase family 4 protein [Sarcina sp.]
MSSSYLKIFNEEMPKILKNIHGIITVSEFSKNDIHQTLNFPKEKIFVTKLAAEEQYQLLDKNLVKNFLKSKYKINDNYILYVGGFSPRKNILGLIEAFSLCKNKLNNNTKLIIIGFKGASYDIYHSKVLDLHLESDVIFTGFIETSDMPYFYNGASMLLYPSFYEGFGLPPLEAMSCGTPVICSNITSIPEVVGDSAILINPLDIYTLADSILELFRNNILRNNLIFKGLNHAKNFSWESTAKETINSYLNIASYNI